MLFQRLLRAGLWANGGGVIYCSSPSAAANPKLSLNDISNVKAKVIRTIRYKGPLCSPPESTGDRKQRLRGEWGGGNVSRHGDLPPSVSFLTKRIFVWFWFCLFFFLSRIKLRRITFFFFKDEWKWEGFPCRKKK